MSESASYWQFFGLQQEPFTVPWTRPVPTGYAQISGYLEARLREAGGPLRPVFRPSALKLLVHHADGDLARLDAISIDALTLASEQACVVVTGTTVQQVLDHGVAPRPLPVRAAPVAAGEQTQQVPPPQNGSRMLTLALIGVALLVGGLGLSMGLLH